MGWLEVPSQISDNFLLSALAAATPFTFSSDVQNGLLETNRGVLFCFVLFWGWTYQLNTLNMECLQSSFLWHLTQLTPSSEKHQDEEGLVSLV